MLNANWNSFDPTFSDAPTSHFLDLLQIVLRCIWTTVLCCVKDISSLLLTNKDTYTDVVDEQYPSWENPEL
jgi:hypothetical protein